MLRVDIFIAAALQGLLSRGITPERCIPEAIDIGKRMDAIMSKND
jgi:hypothetical protein